MQHWAIKLAFGSNFDAPVQSILESGTNVLDSACGPATWTIEMSHTFPSSRFYGTDISSRFPDQVKAGKCEFLVHNILDEPPFEENFFGYIHQRLVILGIKMVDWPKVLENLRFTLKPGGWIELTEFSYVKAENLGPKGQFVIDLSLKVLQAAGLDPDLGSNLPKLLIDAGFTNVQSRSVELPINHGGKVGELFWQDFKEGFKAAKHVYAKMHTEFQEPGVYEKFLDELGEEGRQKKSTIQWTRVIAQKPLADDP
ncbi:S-adenosyl-L-methionine-dependent methyltransferase [Dichotomocladium elegans]|nr:S-adenosyl-L-methionine-dependent methyltransferase [Dichotomocladium elegans]